jgi:two-component system response regulator RegA
MLIVEDDDALRGRLARAFEGRGFDVHTAASAREAATTIDTESPEFVILDLRTPEGNGLDLISKISESDPATRIVVLTGYGSIATAVEAVRRGATNYLSKPANADEILAAFGTPAGEGATSLPMQPMSLDQVEWEHINRVLVECDGNISEAARVLKLHRRSLQRKLAKYPTAR